MPIENLPKGALLDSPDERDYKVTSEMMGAVAVDWSREFRLPDPGNEDQGSSDSCVAQAWSYYHHQLHSKEFRGMERSYYAMPFAERYIWGATAGILRVLYERIYLT